MSHVHQDTWFKKKSASLPSRGQMIWYMVCCPVDTEADAVSRLHDAEGSAYRHASSPETKPAQQTEPREPALDPGQISRNLHYEISSDIVSRHVQNNFIESTSPGLLSMHVLPSPKVLSSPPIPSPITDITETSDTATPSSRYEQLRTYIEENQEDLRDARDDLLGSRFRLRTQRRDLRTTREKTVSRVGGAFDIMRRYFLSNGVDVPDELQTAWTEVDAVRDELGEKEINYEAAEQAYDKEEREYTEKEGLFVDDLSASDSMPTVPVQPAPPADYLDGLTRFSFGPSDVELVPAMPEDLILPPPPTYLTTPEFASGSPTGTPVFEATRHVTPRKHNSVLRSGDATPTQQTPYTGRVMGADGCSHALVKWSDTRNQIEEWMLQSLKSSPLQIRWLKSLVPQGEMSDEDWWQLVDRYWHSDSLDDPVYHTGETIVSGGTVSQVVSSLRDREMLDTVIENNFTAEPSNTAPLLPGDQLVDALELVSFPTRIKPRDLVDVPRRVTFELESQSNRSASTELSHASHSSGPECSSTSTFDDNSSCHSSRDADTIRHGQSGRRDPANTGGCGDNAWEANSTSPEFRSYTPYTRSQAGHGPADAQYGAVCSRSSSDDGSAEPRDSVTHPDTTKFEDCNLASPPPESSHAESTLVRGTRSKFAGARFQTRYPFAPFIWVRSPKPWSLPLLRLNPLPSPSFEDPSNQSSRNRLENTPFVSASNAPFRLPGPSTLPGTSSSDLYY
jgi:hypothetical protein